MQNKNRKSLFRNEEVQKEEKRTNDSIRKLTGEGEVENGVEEADLTTTFSDKDSF